MSKPSHFCYTWIVIYIPELDEIVLMNQVKVYVEHNQPLYSDADAVMDYLFENNGSQAIDIMDALRMPQNRLMEALDYLESRGFVSQVDEGKPSYWIENKQLCFVAECGVSLVGFIDYLLENAPRLDPKYRNKGLTDDDYIVCGTVRKDRYWTVENAVWRYWDDYMKTIPDAPSDFKALRIEAAAFFTNIGIVDVSKSHGIISCTELRMIRRVAKVVDASCGMSFCPKKGEGVYSRHYGEPMMFAHVIQEILYFRYRLMRVTSHHLHTEYEGDTVAIHAYGRISNLVAEGGNRGVRIFSDPLENVCGLSDENRKSLSNLLERCNKGIGEHHVLLQRHKGYS